MEDIGRFVIGDAGYLALYRHARPAQRVLSAGSSGALPGARTLLRQTGPELALCIYYPDDVVSCLERHDPTRRLDDRNVDALSVLVEELDHFLTLAERFRQGGVTSLLELEMHANVTKYLVLKLFLARHRRVQRLAPSDTAWIRYHLFDKAEFVEPDPDVRARYRDAGRLAARYVKAIDRMPPAARIRELRRFHRLSHQGKLARVDALTSSHG